MAIVCAPLSAVAQEQDAPALRMTPAVPLTPAESGVSDDIDSFLSPRKVAPVSMKDVISGGLSASIEDAGLAARPFVAVMVKVTNRSQATVEVLGDESVVRRAGGDEKCLPMERIEAAIDLPDSPRHKYLKDLSAAVQAATTVGAAPAIKDRAVQRGSVRGRYGHDEKRREKLFSRFGKRVLYPGDSTEGAIFFAGKLPAGATIDVPVRDFYYQDNRASLTLTVR